MASVLQTSGPGVTHEKESLANVIERIDPAEVPFYSNCRKGSARAIREDWTVQELQAVADNKNVEGADFSTPTHKIPDRFDNFTQIAIKWGMVSDTYSAVDTVGQARELARQKVIEGLSLKRDIEQAVTMNNAKVGPTGTRELAGMPSWITNAVGGITTFVLPTGDGSDAMTNGVARAFDTAAYIDTVMQMAYIDGGQPRIMYMKPGLKTKFSALPDAWAPGTEHRVTARAPEEITYIGAADAYISDFGALQTVVSRYMAEDGATLNSILLIDPRYVSINTLPGRNFSTEDLGKDGDHDRFKVVWEGTLVVDAPKAHAAVHDLDPAL
jgi:hypothetical protein